MSEALSEGLGTSEDEGEEKGVREALSEGLGTSEDEREEKGVRVALSEGLGISEDVREEESGGVIKIVGLSEGENVLLPAMDGVSVGEDTPPPRANKDSSSDKRRASMATIVATP